MFFHRPKILFIIITFLLTLNFSSSSKCPKQCVCDISHGLKRSACSYRNIVNVNLDIPTPTQSYDLSENLIIKLEDYSFKRMGLTELIILNLSYNKISWIALHALSGLNKLRHLNLSHNRLEGLSPDILMYNLQLDLLDLSGNKFSSIKNEPFLFHKQLKVLNLSDSQIEYIPEKFFNELPSLSILDLSGNFMVTLDISSLLPVTNLKNVALERNHWRCDEKIDNLQQWLSYKKVYHDRLCDVKEKKFEKIITIFDPESDENEFTSDEDLDDVWSIHEEIERNKSNLTKTYHTLSFFDKYDDRFSSFWSLILGFQVGLLVGIFISYCWLSGMCSCKGINWKSRRQMRREGYARSNDMAERLLLNTQIVANSETPPVQRRQNSISPAFNRSHSWSIQMMRDSCGVNVPQNQQVMNGNLPESLRGHPGPQAGRSELQTDCPVSRLSRLESQTSRPETPPPPYQECHNDSIVGI